MFTPKFRVKTILICVVFLLSFKEEQPNDKNFRPETPLAVYFKEKGLTYKLSGKVDSALLYLKKANVLLEYSGNYNESVICLYHLGNIEEIRNNRIAALQYFASANNMIVKNKLYHPLWADVLYKMGRQYFVCDNFGPAYDILYQCIRKSYKIQAQDSTMARTYRLKGLIEYYKGDYKEAIESLKISTVLGEKAFGNYSMFVSDQVNNIGVMAYMIGRDDEALSYYQRSEQIMKEGKISSAVALAGTYTNIGLIFRNRNDYENALQFYNKALELVLPNPNGSTIASIYLNIGALYHSQQNHKKQIEALNKALHYSEKYHPVLLPKVYHVLAIYFSDIKKYDTAEKYYRKAMVKAKQLFTESTELAYIYNNYGEFHAKLKHYDISLTAFQKVVPLYLKFFGEHHPSTATILFNISNHYHDTRQEIKALDYSNKAIAANSKRFSNPDVNAEIEPDKVLSLELMVEILEHKASILNSLAEGSKSLREKDSYLKEAWTTYHTTIKLIDKIRMGYLNDESRLFLYENERNTYIKALGCAIRLYGSTHETSYLEHAFIFTDKTHASSLQSSLREKEIPRNFRFTDTSLVQENSLRKDLSFYQELIIKEQSSRKPDSTKIKFWTSKTTDITFRLKHLLNQLKETKPAWFQYKYHTNDDELIRQVQSNLSDREVLLEYFYSDSFLYSFCLSKKELKHHEEPLTFGLETHINAVFSFVSQPKIYTGDSVAYLNYRAAGWELYKLLIKPYENEIKGKSLVIIPFEKLTYIPFETLLTQESLSQPYNFKELPYLIKQHRVRYLYASNLLNIKKLPNPARNMIAFAPEYKAGANNHQSQDRGGNPFNSLEKTNEEVESIADYFPGKLYRSDEASEENFKKMAGHYSTLHLAMHATIDDSTPMLSRLIFTPHSSKKDDDFLYTYEIPNLQLNADLVILSACNTGVGKLRKGEGMMSLTRSFAFAGVPSIVTTLWSVNDNSSSELMRNFYQSLSTGCTKDIALSEAKLKYIGNSDVIHAHPYYWAGYVLIGDSSPVQKELTVKFILIVILAILLMITGFWLRRRG